MKTPGAVAVFTQDRAVLEATMAAALECGRGVHLASSAPEAFAKIQREIGGVDMFIVDLDAQVHGVTLLNALSFCSDRIPVVVLTSLEKADMEPVARSKGAVACLDKPVTQEQIREVIQQWGSREPEAVPAQELPWFLHRGPVPGAKYGPGYQGPRITENHMDEGPPAG